MSTHTPKPKWILGEYRSCNEIVAEPDNELGPITCSRLAVIEVESKPGRIWQLCAFHAGRFGYDAEARAAIARAEGKTP